MIFVEQMTANPRIAASARKDLREVLPPPAEVR